MQNNLVYIVHVGNDPGFSSVANDSSFPALGVLALGTWICKTLPDVEVVVRDGQVRSTQSIIEEIEQLKPGLVSLSVLATSYLNSLQIAQAAKDCGAYTVLMSCSAFVNDSFATSNKQHFSRWGLTLVPFFSFSLTACLLEIFI